ncbi:MAG: hypothetical protein MZV65_02135 [Chromatiales bacterium]|nr:hypothetical protein [Chromatiales bacterium]
MPGIYRAQANGKVRMTTVAAPHVGPRRRPVRVVVLAAAALCRPGQPAPARSRWCRADRPGVSAAQRGAVLGDARLRAGLRRLQRIPARHGALLDAALADPGRHPARSRRSVIREDLVRFDSLPMVTRAPSVMGARAGREGAAGDFAASTCSTSSFHAEYCWKP